MQPWRRPPPLLTEEEQAALKAQRLLAAQERQEIQDWKNNQKKMWPIITEDFQPEFWIEQYRERHAETLARSVDIYVERIENLDKSEAESLLLEILTKITFVENNLTVNGAQTVETLFENLKKAPSASGDIPFKSIEELSDFLNSMYLNFRKEGDEFRNIGVQGRRWIQFLKNELDNGNYVEEDNFHDLDMNYQKATGHLELVNPEAQECLFINLPIFSDTLNSAHMFKIDFSRGVSTLGVFKGIQFPFRQAFTCAGEVASELGANMFIKHCSQGDKAFDSKKIPTSLIGNSAAVHGNIAPMKSKNPFEVFEVEVSPLSLEDNLCTGTSGKIINSIGDGAREPADIGNVEKVLNDNLKKSVSRPAKVPENA
ncbi:Protein CBG05142 [Caenorhabditis briggsae]|uniref:Protein CBG05142 n=1 Tax=Caenorhabditis briggsae TaxID=6238 RepID=A8WZ65_CAEBR|nr:Protein CBG05142 [Caenorhabditis briggsae]CAP25675.2 Protein CBG05142 [Caenorhabditis briggsae]